LRETLSSLSEEDRDRVFAVVATAGTTNAGVIDDLAGIADVSQEFDIWLHVDGAYGGAGLAAPSVRDRYRGVELADSFIVDPHKWLFSPFDCCALVYRDPSVGRAAHTQQAEYLDVLHSGDGIDNFEWNPSDFAHHLSRRARGLPLWFSLATYGTEAYRDAIEHALDVTRQGAQLIDDAEHLELIMDPELSVLLFRRTGWGPADYQAWSDRLLEEGTAFVTPTSWNGEVVLRLCIINPLTSVDDLRIIVDSLA
jgi:glutamate/tyrosine decarboxylase-like PLP-dependent enzyme